MATSTSTSRLAGLPRIPKVPKKAPKRKSASPPKPKAVPLPRPIPPRPAPLPVPAITLNPSDEDTLSDVSSSDDSDVIIEVVKPKSTSADKGKGKAVPPPPLPAPGFPSLTALPTLPSLPPLPSLPTAAKAPKKAGMAAPPPAPPKPLPISNVAAPLKNRSHKRKEPVTPAPSTSSTPAPKPPVALTSATPKPVAPRTAASPSPAIQDEAAYAPHHAAARSTPSAPQRMSLRQVLALSLQEAEDKAKSQPSTRENTPDATELSRVAAGSAAHGRRERFGHLSGDISHSQAHKGKGKEHLSDVSDLELAGDEDLSDLSSLSSDDDDDVDAVESASTSRSKALEKAEERQIRAEMKRKQARRSTDAMDFDRNTEVDGADADVDDDTSDEDDLAQAWDRNTLALERLHHRLSPDADVGDASLFIDDGEDSDLGVTDIPPGNGIGVVTWSDYDFDDEDDDDDDEDDDDEADQLAAALADAEADGTDEGHTAAGDLEDELEQLFALSEAVAGPINPDEYDFGNFWLETVSDADQDGDESDSLDSNEEGDSDAEMIFGPDGELKRLFGRRRKDRTALAERSADETDESDESSSSERGGLDGATREQRLRPNDADADEEAVTSDSDSTDEATDSSCSDTDIYRYAPQTGALAAVQAPTSAELASLAPAASSATAKSHTGKRTGRKCRRHKAKSTLASIPERAAQSVPPTQPEAPKGPVLGSFEPVQRKSAEVEPAMKVVIVDDTGPAPSPFALPKKTRRRLPDTPSRRARSDSRVSTTSGTSGGESLDFGSNVGSPVLANVVFEFDLESVLHESLLAEDDDDSAIAMDIDSSSETDADAAATPRAIGRKTSQPISALSDLSRWARIPIGAFRSRTTGGDVAPAVSQVLAAQAAELGKVKRKAAGRARAGAAAAMLRDRKAADSLNHTLGSPGQGSSAAPSKRAIASRMLTSPVLAPTVRDPARPSAAKPTSAKKSKRSKSTTSKRALSGRGRTHGREAAGPTSSSNLTAPTASLPPLHSPLFRSVSDHPMLEPPPFRLN